MCVIDTHVVVLDRASAGFELHCKGRRVYTS